MKQLRVLIPFRDKDNFFVFHKVGETIEVSDPKRITFLVDSGLCEVVKAKQQTIVMPQEPSVQRKEASQLAPEQDTNADDKQTRKKVVPNDKP